MRPSHEERQEYLKKLRTDDTKRIGSKKIYFNGQPQLLGIYQVNLKHLIFNRHNGRLETEMLSWEAEHGVQAETYTDELHSLISGFLWNANVRKNQSTLKDIKEKSQLTPGIVTLDGVIIDGNRRAMLLEKLGKEVFEAVILPDAYEENEKEIVKLETQYQLGEDEKVGYGPLEKYLHAKRLNYLGIKNGHELMGLDSEGEFQRLIDIMELMDQYLDYIECQNFYNLLKESDGSTKEGMFVDLYADLKKLRAKSTTMVTWDYDDVDVDELAAIQFDHIRFGSYFTTEGKQYRQISHGSAERKNCFFAHKDIWDSFAKSHLSDVASVTENLPTLDEFWEDNSEDFESRVDAARALTERWKSEVDSGIKKNFGVSSDKLETKIGTVEPYRLLNRALSAMQSIDIDGSGLVSNDENKTLVHDINQLSYEMKKRFR